MKRILWFMSVCGILCILNGCGVTAGARQAESEYPSPDCASNPDHPIDSIVTYTPPPSTMTELANQSDLVVMGVVIGEGPFGVPPHQEAENPPYRHIRRYYTFHGDT